MKKGYLFFVIFVFLISIASVCASEDLNQTDMLSEEHSGILNKNLLMMLHRVRQRMGKFYLKLDNGM